MIKLTRAVIILLVLFSLILLSASLVYAGDILFETVISWFSSWVGAGWGNSLNGGFTYTQSVSIGYKPAIDQEVCTIKVGLYKLGSPTDNIAITVRTSANNGYPIGGPVMATAILSADQVSGPPILPQQTIYTVFSFSPCLNLTSNTRYSFILTRTQPGSSGNYVSQISNQIYYPETSFWQYVPVNGFWQESINYEPALRLEGPEEPPSKEPVIIVPGILGSRLSRASDGEEVWLHTAKMFSPITLSDDYLDDLKLDNNGNEVLDMNSPGVVESVLGFNQYGNLIQKFKDDGYILGRDLFVMPYDWRLDITTSSQDLDSVVTQALSNSLTGKVNIVAHSMGGLLVKDYLMRNSDSKVNKLIFAGTPHLGAPKAFNVLNWGDDFGLKLIELGLNKNKAKEIAQNMPAVYELLPSREYLSEAGSYVKDDAGTSLDYDQINQFLSSSPLLKDHRNSNILTQSDEFHQSHDNWLPQSANVYNLLGCREYDTIGSFKLDSDDSVDIDSVTGDGTVPLVSAKHIPGQNYFVSYPQTKINHTGLISDDRTIGLLYSLAASKSYALPTGISKIESDCDNIINEVKRLRFSTHSPVNLHVYDNLGHHTGLNPDGTIGLGIPDSNLIQVGGNTFIFVPDNTQYSVKIDAYATGSFDFKVKELKNGQVDSSLIYDDIQINNLGLEASFEFSSTASSSLLSVDENGDGEVDVGYSLDGERILYHGIENVVSDINMAYELGWISTKQRRDAYLRKLEKVLKIEKKIELLVEKLPDGSKKEKRIERLEKEIDRVLAIQFLRDLEKDYNKERINERAYNLTKEDILWLLTN